ncbi:OLC1v1012848C1 [Oldenlandia corymbosa var. corymbosa]|uniref:OLC1v1012848C1 n=1 Tax=Oldenlandia corymbosa var. corymbosa TaxID=529605 RepID=A0AAV1DX35_OLDCO|nr:OLC1v1012848C1 [Oldenlandia corymbosa var. corymbosa]
MLIRLWKYPGFFTKPIVQSFLFVRPFCQSSPNLNSVVQTITSLVQESYNQQQQQRAHFSFWPAFFKRNFPVEENSDLLTPEEAITVAASLANTDGSMVALGFFYWAIELPKFRHFMRFYLVLVMCLMKNGNSERANEVMHCMVRNFGEVGLLKEAVDMVFEMQNQGLVLSVHTLNCVLNVALEISWLDLAENVFDEMCKRGVSPNSCSFESMVVGYCRLKRVMEADRWLVAMLERGYLVDNATCTLVMDVFCETDCINRALWIFGTLCDIGDARNAYKLLKTGFESGFSADLVTYTVLISESCKRADLRQALAFLTKMVKSGIMPDVHVYTTLISAFCKENRMCESEKLFDDAFLKLGKLCSEKKVDIAAMFFDKLLEKTHNVDRVTLAAFMRACYDSNNYALVSNVSEKIIGQNGESGTE